MAEVYGTIGNQPVELNNAATERTLRELVNAIRNAGGVGAANRASGMAQAAGVSQEAVKAANVGLSKTGETAKIAGERLGTAGGVIGTLIKNSSEFNKKLVEGSAQGSDFINVFSKLPGVAGQFAAALTAAARYQEENLKVYQSITSAGINFAGSLTDIRMAAGQTRLTLDNLNSLLTKNGDAFARMGSTADRGAKNFIALSSALQDSQLGNQLRNLGFTTDEINQSMVNYIAATGGRTTQEMQNTSRLAAASASYMTELDALAAIHGKNRKELEEEGKKAAANAAYQRKLATLGEEERAKLELARKAAIASGIKGAEDLIMSSALGLPPMTEAARLLSGMAPGVADGLNSATKAAMTQGKTQADVNAELDKTRIAARQAAENFGQVGDAVVLQGGAAGDLVNSLIADQNKQANAEIKNEQDLAQQRAQVEEDQRKRQKSQASDVLSLQQAIEKLRISALSLYNTLVSFVTPAFTSIGGFINNFVTPAFDMLKKAVDFLTPYVNVLVSALTGVWEWYTSSMESLYNIAKPHWDSLVETLRPVIQFIERLGFTANELQAKFDRMALGFKKLDEYLGGYLSPTLAGLVTALGAYLLLVKSKTAAEKTGAAAGTTRERAGGAAQGILNRRGSSPDMPLYVQIVRGAAVGGGGGTGGTGGGRGGGTGGGGGGGGTSIPGPTSSPTPAPAPGGGGGGYKIGPKFFAALKTLRGIPGLSVLLGALDVIAVASETVGEDGVFKNEDEYKSALYGAIGGAVSGGLGAAAGAALGTLLFPGVGTLIGGVAGGLVGNMAGDKLTQAIYNKFFAEGAGELRAIPGMEKGGYVSSPTLALIGEGGEGEIVTPESKMRSLIAETINEVKNQGGSGIAIETLSGELERLNSNMDTLIRYMKETAEYTRNNVSATKALNNNLFS